MKMERYKVVFTTERGHRHQQAALDAAPAALDITMLRQPDRDTLVSYLRDADYLISERAGKIDAGLIQSAPKLKLILRLGSLTYDIDLDAARQAGVAVCYWPVLTVIRVAEHMVMQMLALSKKLVESEAVALNAGGEWGPSRRTDEDTFAYNWSSRQEVEGLWSKTEGILGFGEIGVELARRLQGFGCTVFYNKRRRLPQPVELEFGLKYVDRDTLISQSDYVANLLPYFAETDGLIGAHLIGKMKDGAFLASCGSGSVIDEAALAAAIRSGKLGGAALDTFEWEPIKPDNPLIQLANEKFNVLLTPHIAAGAEAAARVGRVGDYFNIVNHIEGKPLRFQLV
ncbi:MAG: NAD(P)-dependent oxidoreductase [Candidatus Promineifilaceae bacterium]